MKKEKEEQKRRTPTTITLKVSKEGSSVIEGSERSGSHAGGETDKDSRKKLLIRLGRDSKG